MSKHTKGPWEVGNIVRDYEAKIYKGGKVETKVTENKILAVNDEYICIDNYCFQALEKKSKSSIYNVIDKVSISDWTNFKWSSYLFMVSLQTTTMSQKVVSGKMTREFRAYLDKKLSVYLYDVDIKISFAEQAIAKAEGK